MNHSTLEKEIKDYSDYNKQSMVIISKISQFCKYFGQQGKKKIQHQRYILHILIFT